LVLNQIRSGFSKVELDPNQIITKGRDDVQDEVVIVTNFRNWFKNCANNYNLSLMHASPFTKQHLLERVALLRNNDIKYQKVFSYWNISTIK
jgi:hypothetical protein